MIILSESLKMFYTQYKRSIFSFFDYQIFQSILHKKMFLVLYVGIFNIYFIRLLKQENQLILKFWTGQN